jgi:hypothetical protein
MKIKLQIFSAVMAGIACLPLGGFGLALSCAGVGVDNPPAPAAQTGTNLASNDPASKLCALGTRAIDQGRWADAVRTFSRVAGQHGEHADGALYWEAYAENKLGDSKSSLDSCAQLRSNYPKSRWVEDCGALEVEIQAKSGKKVRIEPGQSDDVKLLALNAMMRQNEPQALAEIQEILNGDSSEKLRKEAEFILGHHYSDTTYAQIVRISYVDGDVRIQRGEPNGRPSSAIWEKAAADLPVETGFSLATGDGRAEIEFENASTIYLGPNSVLTFNDLHETAGVPFTEMALLSGTVSLYFHPYVAFEKMILHTPTNDLVARYPDKTNARVEAFTDAVAITSLAGGDLRLPGVARDAVVPGRTFIWLNGQLVDAQSAQEKQVLAARDADRQTTSAWDQWVSGRVAQRNSAIASVMEASGLSAPIPGMAEMAGQGKFFDCAPYGTCWEPRSEADADQGAAAKAGSQSYARPARSTNQGARLVTAAYHPAAAPANAAQYGTAAEADDLLYNFPCTPLALRYRTMRDPATGRMTVVGGPLAEMSPYSWAVCHAGSWVRHKRHYVWVAGGKRRHADPVRWVKSDRKVGFVPIHPYDVKGRPAINVAHGFFAIDAKNGIVVEPVRPEPGHPVDFLKTVPKEYRTAQMRPLTVAEAPHMEAHPFPAGTRVETARVGVPIHFDAKTQMFMTARQQVVGGKTTTVVAPMSNRSGSLQARGGSFSGASGFHGGSGAGAAGGGGSHGGGGGSSAGGGSHGGGSVSSASASSSGGGASAGGGSHH